MTITAAITGLIAEGSSLWTIGGLPLHPLLVHVVVVVLPLGVLGLLAVLFVPKWRQAYGLLAVGALAVGAVAALAAVKTGEQLMLVTGISEDHQKLGKLMGIVGVVNAAVGLVWYWPTRNTRGKADRNAPLFGRGLQAWTGLAAAGLSVISLVLIALVGHSGATDVWKGKLQPTPVATASATASTGASAGALTAAEVAKHNTPSDCWAVINGNVYDLTSWIPRHPGGQSVIKALCGADGTAAFTGQHGNQGGPNQLLQGFLKGPLK